MLKRIALVPVIFFTLIVSSCSKENKTERNLFRGNGAWHIKQMTEVKFENNAQVAVEITENPGDFEFNENKTGELILFVQGSLFTEFFSWDVTENELYVLLPGNGIYFTIRDETRKTMELEYSEEELISGVIHKTVYNYSLKRDN